MYPNVLRPFYFTVNRIIYKKKKKYFTLLCIVRNKYNALRDAMTSNRTTTSAVICLCQLRLKGRWKLNSFHSTVLMAADGTGTRHDGWASTPESKKRTRKLEFSFVERESTIGAGPHSRWPSDVTVNGIQGAPRNDRRITDDSSDFSVKRSS